MTSLFRYGNRLLLRACCCPPPPPPPPCSGPCEDASDCKPGCDCVDGICVGEEDAENCFCGSWCSYKGEWDGNLPLTSAITTGGPPFTCEPGGPQLDYRTFSGSYGVIPELDRLFNTSGGVFFTNSRVNRFASGFGDSNQNLGLGTPGGRIIASIEVYHRIIGQTECLPDVTCFGAQDCTDANQAGRCYANYSHIFVFYIECVGDPDINSERNVLRFTAYILEDFTTLRFNTKSSSPYLFGGYAEGVIESECKSVVQCPESPSAGNTKHVHIDGNDLEVSWSAEGLTIGGVAYEWQPFFYVNQREGDYWETDDFPASETVTLKREATCAPGECDCNASLTGMEVEFEGQTFIYGNGDSFISEDSSTFWEEGPTGTFTRYDRESCDNTLNQRVKKAQVLCDNFLDEENNSIPRWFVLLDHDCFERDQDECSATPVASRLSGWSGAFFCNSDGKPVGTPHSFDDSSQPPDVDFETVSDTPAPSGDCSGANAIPQFRFV